MTVPLTNQHWITLLYINDEIDAGRLVQPFESGTLISRILDGPNSPLKYSLLPTPGVLEDLKQAGMLEVKVIDHRLTKESPLFQGTQEMVNRALGYIQVSYYLTNYGRVAAESYRARLDPHARSVYLARFLDLWFDKEDLQNLCFELDVDYDNLKGEKKETKARDLVVSMHNRGRLEELERKIASLRPQQYQAPHERP